MLLKLSRRTQGKQRPGRKGSWWGSAIQVDYILNRIGVNPCRCEQHNETVEPMNSGETLDKLRKLSRRTTPWRRPVTLLCLTFLFISLCWKWNHVTVATSIRPIVQPLLIHKLIRRIDLVIFNREKPKSWNWEPVPVPLSPLQITYERNWNCAKCVA